MDNSTFGAKIPVYAIKAAHRLGLSTKHIPSPDIKRKLKVARGGSLVVLAGVRPPTVGRGGARGKVKEFSGGSRRRLMRLLASINRLRLISLPVFVTLTYPGAWSDDAASWKRDLEVWLNRLRRRAPEASAVWRLEFQRRGAPHFHLLVFGVAELPKDWVARSWFEVVGSRDMAHLAAGTRVERVRSWRGVMSYAAKYMGKRGSAPSGEPVGRFWGVHNRQGLPIDIVEAEVLLSEFYAVRRVLVRYLAGMGRHHQVNRYDGLTVYLDWSVGVRLLEIYGSEDCTGGAQ